MVLVDEPLAAAVLLGLSTASMTWTTPLLMRMSGFITFAELMNTLPFATVMVMLPPPSVRMVVLARELLYAMVPLMTWYLRMSAAAVVLRLDNAVEMSWKAVLLGAKIVTSFKPPIALVRLLGRIVSRVQRPQGVTLTSPLQHQPRL